MLRIQIQTPDPAAPDAIACPPACRPGGELRLKWCDTPEEVHRLAALLGRIPHVSMVRGPPLAPKLTVQFERLTHTTEEPEDDAFAPLLQSLLPAARHAPPALEIQNPPEFGEAQVQDAGPPFPQRCRGAGPPFPHLEKLTVCAYPSLLLPSLWAPAVWAQSLPRLRCLAVHWYYADGVQALPWQAVREFCLARPDGFVLGFGEQLVDEVELEGLRGQLRAAGRGSVEIVALPPLLDDNGGELTHAVQQGLGWGEDEVW